MHLLGFTTFHHNYNFIMFRLGAKPDDRNYSCAVQKENLRTHLARFSGFSNKGKTYEVKIDFKF